MSSKVLTLWLPHTAVSTVKVQLTVVEDGLGATDPENARQPTVQEMDAITEALQRRQWTFTKPI